MPDAPESAGPPSDAAGAAAAPSRPGFLRRHWGKLTLTVLVTVPVLILAIWTTLAMSFTYSSGERVGWVQKLSKRGWVCKTWEGELQMSNVPGSAPTLFEFSVRSDSIAHLIEASEGKKVALTYKQHTGVPLSCLGDTEYFIAGIRVLEP